MANNAAIQLKDYFAMNFLVQYSTMVNYGKDVVDFNHMTFNFPNLATY